MFLPAPVRVAGMSTCMAAYIAALKTPQDYAGEHYTESGRTDRSPDKHDSARKRHISDFDGRSAGGGSKRLLYVPETKTRFTFVRVESGRALRGSSNDCLTVTFGLWIGT